MSFELFRHVNQDTRILLDCPIYLVAFCEKTLPRPFLLFLLEQQEYEPNVLSFPQINGPVENIASTLVDVMPGQYVGQVIYNKCVYVFVKTDVQQLQPSNKRWFCLLDEILNYQMVIHFFKVSTLCVDFLFSNPAYYRMGEIPYVAFICSDNEKQTKITHYFGPVKENYDYYTFTVCNKPHFVRYAIFGTTPTTENEVTTWRIKTLTNAVALSWH
jgi:hypothetical protein